MLCETTHTFPNIFLLEIFLLNLLNLVKKFLLLIDGLWEIIVNKLWVLSTVAVFLDFLTTKFSNIFPTPIDLFVSVE